MKSFKQLFEANPDLTVAVKYGEKVHRAPPDIINHSDLAASIPSEQKTARHVDGFMDHRGRFLDRDKALEYAHENGLIHPEYTGKTGKYLIAQHLTKYREAIAKKYFG
jgi:hypothetical protein